MSCLILALGLGAQRHICKLIIYIYYVAQQFYSIYPALPEYSTFYLASRWQPVVHGGFSADGQLVTLVYRGKTNDLTPW